MPHRVRARGGRWCPDAAGGSNLNIPLQSAEDLLCIAEVELSADHRSA